MDILHIIASCNPRHGGPIEGVRQIGNALRNAGHVQTILTLDHEDAPWLKNMAATVHALGEKPVVGDSRWHRLRRWASITPEAILWLRSNVQNYDGVVVNGLWNFSTLTAAAVLPRSKTPYIVFTHGMLAPWFAAQRIKHLAKRIFWKFNEGRLLRSASAVVFTSSREGSRARTTFPHWNMRELVVGYGTSPAPPATAATAAAFARQVPDLGDRPYLLSVGRIHKIKACDVLISAFAGVAGDHPDLDLVFAGPGDPVLVDQLVAQAKSLGIDSRIHWAGMLAGDAKWGGFYGCTAHVLASHHENFGMVVAEAMSCSRPVVISDKVDICDEIAQAGAGIVGTDAVEGFQAALSQFLALTEPERDEMGARARSLFDRKYRIEATMDAVVNVFEDARQGKMLPRIA